MAPAGAARHLRQALTYCPNVSEPCNVLTTRILGKVEACFVDRFQLTGKQIDRRTAAGQSIAFAVLPKQRRANLGKTFDRLLVNDSATDRRTNHKPAALLHISQSTGQLASGYGCRCHAREYAEGAPYVKSFSTLSLHFFQASFCSAGMSATLKR